MEKYEQQLQRASCVQSSEFKAKIIDTRSYGELIDSELKKIDVINLSRHIHLLTLFLPEQWIKRGSDHDCLLLILLIERLICKCDLLIREIEKKFERIDTLTIDDVIKSHRAEQWSFACKLLQLISIVRMNLRKFVKYSSK
jgi:dynactin 1